MDDLGQTSHPHYQRVTPIKSHETSIFLWFSYGFPVFRASTMEDLGQTSHRPQIPGRLRERAEATQGEGEEDHARQLEPHHTWRLTALGLVGYK